MSSLIKSSLFFFSIAIVFMVVFILPVAFIPVSESLLEKIKPENMQLFFPLLLVLGFYMALSYWLLIKNTRASINVLFAKLAAAHFIIYPLMGLLEALFWGDAFQGVETSEFIKIFIRFSITYLVFSGYLVLLYKMKNPAEQMSTNTNAVRKKANKILIIAVLYFAVYNIFGYFVAWQFDAVREFYSGSTEIKDFWSAMWQNIRDPWFVIVHIFRGVLFAIAAHWLYSLLQGARIRKMIILTLVFGGFGLQIMLPNPLLPGIIGTAHFIETTSSMWVFGFLAAWILSLK